MIKRLFLMIVAAGLVLSAGPAAADGTDDE